MAGIKSSNVEQISFPIEFFESILEKETDLQELYKYRLISSTFNKICLNLLQQKNNSLTLYFSYSTHERFKMRSLIKFMECFDSKYRAYSKLPYSKIAFDLRRIGDIGLIIEFTKLFGNDIKECFLNGTYAGIGMLEQSQLFPYVFASIITNMKNLQEFSISNLQFFSDIRDEVEVYTESLRFYSLQTIVLNDWIRSVDGILSTMELIEFFNSRTHLHLTISFGIDKSLSYDMPNVLQNTIKKLENFQNVNFKLNIENCYREDISKLPKNVEIVTYNLISVLNTLQNSTFRKMNALVLKCLSSNIPNTLKKLYIELTPRLAFSSYFSSTYFPNLDTLGIFLFQDEVDEEEEDNEVTSHLKSKLLPKLRSLSVTIHQELINSSLSDESHDSVNLLKTLFGLFGKGIENEVFSQVQKLKVDVACLLEDIKNSIPKIFPNMINPI